MAALKSCQSNAAGDGHKPENAEWTKKEDIAMSKETEYAKKRVKERRQSRYDQMIRDSEKISFVNYRRPVYHLTHSEK